MIHTSIEYQCIAEVLMTLMLTKMAEYLLSYSQNHSGGVGGWNRVWKAAAGSANFM
jgi:hypothetical protein